LCPNPVQKSDIFAHYGLLIASNLNKQPARSDFCKVLPSRFNTSVAEQIVFWIHKNILALDVSDPRTTIVGTEFRLPVTRFDNPLFVSESITGNPVHLIVLLVAVFLYASQRKNWSAGRNIYLLNLLAVLVVFNVLIAWQPWISRLHLPFFVLASPFVGTIIACYLNRFGIYCLVALMIVSSLPCVFFSAARPLVSQSLFRTASKVSIYEIPRSDRYFVTRPELKSSYESAVLDIQSRGCRDTGIIASENAWDYPVWAIAQRQPDSRSFRFRSVLVENPSKDLAPSNVGGFTPCALLVLQRPDMSEEITLAGLNYRLSSDVNSKNRGASVYYPLKQ
jgi:hypothetical protein